MSCLEPQRIIFGEQKPTSRKTQDFEVALALEYVTKAKDKSKQLMHIKQFYDNTNRRADVVLDELSNLQTLLLAERAMKK